VGVESGLCQGAHPREKGTAASVARGEFFGPPSSIVELGGKPSARTIATWLTGCKLLVVEPPPSSPFAGRSNG
jgi:hypothetical protein